MRFGDFEILARHEAGGGGFDARARGTDGREVCLWVGAPGACGSESAAELAAVQAALGKVYHPGLPRVLGRALIDGRAVLIVQAYRGVTLSERLAAGPLEDTVSLDVARSVAAVLQKAHAAGLFHGAVGPDEILLAEDGRTLLLHLGLQPFLGPRPPRAPEELDTPGGSPSADVFGLARVLIRCLTGEDPLERADPEAAARALREGFAASEASFPSRLPQGLRRFLARSVHPDPARRIHRAEEFAGDLGVIRASWEAFREPSGPSALARVRFPGRSAVVAIVVGAAALIALWMRSCAP